MTHRRTIQPRNDESGLSLPATLITLAVGLILIVPLLTSTSTGMLGSRAADLALLRQYSLDAGVEYGIWKLRYDPAFRATVDAVPLTPVAVTPAMSLNGFSPSVTAMALSSSGWDTSPANTPASVQPGGALAFASYSGTDYLFALRGGSQTFWRYGLLADSWLGRANTGTNMGNGAALTWDGASYIYALRGNNQTTFRRYTPDSWTPLRAAPLSVREGGALAYANGFVYALRGRGTDDFWRYTPPPPGTGTWASGANDPADPPGNVGAGGALVYAGANQFYALQGGGQTGFWRYSSTGNSWTALADTPAAVDAGGSLVYPGGDFIYAFRGNNTTDFWRYNILGDSWAPQAIAPAAVGAGGSLAYPGGDYIYALRGQPSADFWRYRVQPPRYDVVSVSGTRTTTTRVEIEGTNVTVLFWDVQ